ncbi:Rne/Rng family ribonuclease [Longimicrobium sp.]|uniref:Rne/Rng family ribonuclease n=1 Tax=Longimicrobium sp. TaxID=2029185 RepID=UPI002E373254|nr:Rne/Rng family ribonuclease [Longimicrobium sp.]HEX6039954.1 Rne/Rng family ribonuclease [Longimicrobium sp.]
MKREILMNTTARETRVAILEDDVLVELMVDRPDAARMVGDVYKGRVEAVLPGIQAAFVDIGTEKAAFLHVSDVALDDDDDEPDEPGAPDDADETPEAAANGGGGGGRRGRKVYPAIQDVLKKGQDLLVQVSKEPISTKGPRVTANISLPGRFLVYMPGSSHVGVSRKIEDREERTRLRTLAREVLPEKSGGIIVRTVSEDLTRETFERELRSLMSTWGQIQKKAKKSRAPAAVHREAKLTAGIIRDLFSQKVDSLTVDSRNVYDEIVAYLEQVDPSLVERVHLYSDSKPLFDAYDLEREIRDAFQRRVNLPSGGYIIMEPTEALVSIDVNTGRYTGKKDPEKTILKTNVDAAREIARQLRLRDVGGIIVCDFIDMETKANRDKVLQELRQHLSRDRARTKAFQVSELGLIEMTRQRVRPSLYHTQTEPCPTCDGTGRIFTPETVVRRIERALRRAGADGKDRQITVRVHPEVALFIIEQEPKFLKELEKSLKLQLALRDDPLMQPDEIRLVATHTQQDLSGKYNLG